MKGKTLISGKCDKIIYEKEKKGLLKTARPLSYGTLYRDNFQKQSVQRAYDIFSLELIAVIKTHKSDGTPGVFYDDETIKVIEVA